MKKVIEFYKKNKAISNIGIVAIIISISYAITYNMPDYFGIEPYYALANNICISYIAALIFFVVQVYIPERKNQKNCMEILKNKFADITKFNEIAVLLCEEYIKINEKGATISWNGDSEKIYLKSKSSDASEGPNLSRYTKTELLNWKKVFDEKLKMIKESAVINYCDYDVLEKLSELERQDFFTALANVIRFADTDIDIQSFNGKIKEFKQINEELKSICSISKHYQLIDVTKEEILQVDSIYKSIASNSFSIQSFNKEIIKATIEEQLKEQGVKISSQEIEILCDTVMSSSQSTK